MATPIEAGFNLRLYSGLTYFDATFRHYDSGGSLIGAYQALFNLSDFGDYSHSGFGAWGAGYPSVISAIEADIPSYPGTLNFDATTGRYTLTPDNPGELVGVTFNETPFRDLFGFDASINGAAASHTSDNTVPFWFDCTHGIGEYVEDTDQAEQPDFRVTNGGHVYGLGDGNSAVLMDFVVKAEEQAKVFDWKAAAGAYTLQQHYEHCRWLHPFLVYHEFGTALHTFQPEKANFRHKRFFDSSDTHWDVPFATYVART